MSRFKFAAVLTMALLFPAGMAFAQAVDPGVQSANRGTGRRRCLRYWRTTTQGFWPSSTTDSAAFRK